MANIERRKRRKQRSTQKARPGTLRFIPLGGLGEIGKNMFAIEYGNDIVLVDCGLMFPEEEMLGIDFVIPDISYLEENRERIRGIILTHGHEDHIGALPFVLPKLNVPVYGTCLTLGLVKQKLMEAIPTYDAEFHQVQAGDKVKLGIFTISFIAVCHSIPDGVGLAIDTPLGTIVHTGDFKLDPTPIDGRVTDYSTFAELGKKGVLLMLSDSTNVEKNGFTRSERMLSGTLERLFRLHRNHRIIISAFASNLHRVQQILDTAVRFNRKVAFIGRSMVSNVDLALELGYLKAEKDIIVPMSDVGTISPNRLVIVTTGSQGEPFSGLVLMSKGEHHHIKLGPRDVVAVFARPIPGNEKLVSNTINRLFQHKCEVIYEADRGIHVSGHASREELKMMLSMIRPRYFVPVHGEYRMLVRHGQLAREVGVPSKNVFVMLNGDVLSITDKHAQARGRVQAGGVLVDGLSMGTMESSIMRERKDLAEEGVIMVSVTLNDRFKLVADPVIESRGIIHMQDAPAMRVELVDAMRKVVKTLAAKKNYDTEVLEGRIVSRCRELIRKHTRARSIVVPIVSIINK